MRTRRLLPVLLGCSALSLAGCGGSSLLDGDSASDLQRSLASVRTAIDGGQCSEARSAAREGTKKVDELPSSVDAELKSTLKAGFQDLTSRVASDCDSTDDTTTTTPPPTTTTAPPVDTTTTETDPVEPVDPGTTDTQPIDPPTTDQTDPTDPSGPGSGGGTGGDDDSGGVTPGVDGPGAGGPGASERATPRGKDVAKDLRKRFKDARKRAEKYLRGQGAG